MSLITELAEVQAGQNEADFNAVLRIYNGSIFCWEQVPHSSTPNPLGLKWWSEKVALESILGASFSPTLDVALS